jgi:YegS/Rv2252/BmrU family lipid kinase
VSQLVETECLQERVAFIFNPVSGTQDPVARRSKLEQLAREAGITAELGETDLEEGAKPLAQQALKDGVDRIIVSGGDGSIAEAADIVAGTDTVLGVVPGGTGNLLAVNLGLSTDPATAVRVAATAPPRAIDVGRANGHVFLIVAGIGADAQMVQDADRDLKRRWGVLAYFIAAWRNLGRPLGRYRITIDGQTFYRRAQTILVGNMGRITGGVELIPGADPADGMFDVAIIRARHFRDVATVGIRAILGRHQSDDLTQVFRGRRIIIETNRPQPFEVDGNDLGNTRRLEITLQPKALRLAVPEPTTPNFPHPAAFVAEVTARPLWVPLVAGVGTCAALAIRARVARQKGAEPDWASRHPIAMGAAVASLLGAAITINNSAPAAAISSPPPDDAAA